MAAIDRLHGFCDPARAVEFASDPGSRIKKLYTGKILDNGDIELVETGEMDIQEEIQSYAQSCDMQVIVRRFLNGEVDVLQQKQGFYGDVTTMPKTYAEFLQKQIDAQNLWYQLPIGVRDKFGQSFERFLATAGSEEWYASLGVTQDSPAAPSAGSEPAPASAEAAT